MTRARWGELYDQPAREVYNHPIENHCPPHHSGTLREVHGYHLAVVRCILCRYMWVRQIPNALRSDECGSWLCPRGWGNGCHSNGYQEVSDRPDVEAAWRLTGMYAFGDVDGHPP